MAQSRGARSLLGTVVGYVLLALIAYFLLRIYVGTIFWLLRTILVIAVVGGLFALYIKLKLPKK
jgi:hypothetical protein